MQTVDPNFQGARVERQWKWEDPNTRSEYLRWRADPGLGLTFRVGYHLTRTLSLQFSRTNIRRTYFLSSGWYSQDEGRYVHIPVQSSVPGFESRFFKVPVWSRSNEIGICFGDTIPRTDWVLSASISFNFDRYNVNVQRTSIPIKYHGDNSIGDTSRNIYADIDVVNDVSWNQYSASVCVELEGSRNISDLLAFNFRCGYRNVRGLDFSFYDVNHVVIEAEYHESVNGQETYYTETEKRFPLYLAGWYFSAGFTFYPFQANNRHYRLLQLRKSN